MLPASLIALHVSLAVLSVIKKICILSSLEKDVKK
jgi:hypothetical protein